MGLLEGSKPSWLGSNILVNSSHMRDWRDQRLKRRWALNWVGPYIEYYSTVWSEQCFCPAVHVPTCALSILQCCCTCGLLRAYGSTVLTTNGSTVLTMKGALKKGKQGEFPHNHNSSSMHHDGWLPSCVMTRDRCHHHHHLATTSKMMKVMTAMMTTRRDNNHSNNDNKEDEHATTSQWRQRWLWRIR